MKMIFAQGLRQRIWIWVFVLVVIIFTTLKCVPFSYADEARWMARSETIIQTLERNAGGGTTLPVYEYVNLDYGQPDLTGLGIHLYGWGRMALQGEDYYTDNPDGELLYGYVSYRFAENNFQARLGRMEMVSHSAYEGFDGLHITAPLSPFLDVELLGGLPFSEEGEGEESGDLIYGGSLSLRGGSLYHLTAGYKSIVYDTIDDEQILNVNLGFQPFAPLYFSGRTTYNLATQEWAEHAYQLTGMYGNLSIAPYYQRYQFADIFGDETGSSPPPFRVFANTDDVLDVMGGSIEWRADAGISTGITVEQYTHSENDVAALASQLRLGWQPFPHLQLGVDVGFVDGDTDQTSYRLGRLFFYLDQIPVSTLKFYFSGDVLLAQYDEALSGKDQSLDLSGSVGTNFFNDTLEFKLTGEYSENPYFLEDFRGTVILIYNIGT